MSWTGSGTPARKAGNIRPLVIPMYDEEFLARMDAHIDQIKQGERLPGVDELLVPGERGHRRCLELSARGVMPLAAASWQVLVTGSESVAAPLPSVIID